MARGQYCYISLKFNTTAVPNPSNSKILARNIRQKQNPHQVILDDSIAGKRTYLDVQKLTKERALPQIFVNETYIGGLGNLKVNNYLRIYLYLRYFKVCFWSLRDLVRGLNNEVIQPF